MQPHERVVLVGNVLAQQKQAEQRNQRQRKEQRADQRAGDGPGHRREDAALVPLQREDRDVRGDDDEHREEGGPAHFDRRLLDGRRAGRFGRCPAFNSPSWRKMFSTTMTAPSTMMPKSIAPSESRLAGNAAPGQPDERGQQRQAES